MKTPLKFYIKERHNPQLGVYYIRMGRMTKKNAKDAASASYGYNIMRPFDTQEAYDAEIAHLEEKGERVQ